MLVKVSGGCNYFKAVYGIASIEWCANKDAPFELRKDAWDTVNYVCVKCSRSIDQIHAEKSIDNLIIGIEG